MKVIHRALPTAGLLILAAHLGATPPSPPIDASGGVIDGKMAISFWGAVSPGAGETRPEDLLDPRGLQARMVSERDLDIELGFPCGEWISPLPGRYRYWLEGADLISPATHVLSYTAPPFRGKGHVSVRHLVPAGRIALPPERPLGPDRVLRLLHTESHNRGARPLSEMSRRVTGPAASQGVLMPEGKVLAGIFDRREGAYLGISRPVGVYRGATTFVEPRPPSAPGSDLLVVLERPARLRAFEEYDVRLTVSESPGPGVAPDVTVPTAGRLYAVWFGLEGRAATLRAESGTVFLEPVDIVLRPGKVESYRGELRPLPDLKVELALPETMALAKDAAIEVRSLPSRALVERQQVLPQRHSYLFSSVPSAALEVVFDTRPWEFVRRVDLSDGLSGSVLFQPEAHRVSGTVSMGSEPTLAEVTFRLKRDYSVTFATTESGRYEGVLFRGGMYVAMVQPLSSQGKPHMEILKEPVEDGAVFDFHLPANRFTVQVVDRDTGDRIEGALVVSSNTSEAGDRSVTRDTTDGEGRAVLRPLLSGEASIWAEADGYLRSTARSLTVRPEDREREVTLKLERIEALQQIRLLLPDGSPAAAAELLAVASLDQGSPAWRGRSDGQGRLEIPLDLAASFLLVRHPRAAFQILPPGLSELGADDSSWTLPAAAAPLAVRLKRSWGDSAPWAKLAIWVGGHRVSGATLRWLTYGGAADDEGVWRAGNLPRAPLKLLGWMASGDAPTPILAEALAISLPFPWDDLVEVQTIN